MNNEDDRDPLRDVTATFAASQKTNVDGGASHIPHVASVVVVGSIVKSAQQTLDTDHHGQHGGA
jgi:hypothetical protein